MAIDPDVACVQILESDSVLTLVKGRNLFRGPVRPPSPESGMPHCAVFCLTTGGPEPIRFLGGIDPDCGGLTEPNVQVTVRGEVASAEGSFDSGQTVAKDVWRALERADVTTLESYLKFDAQSSEPLYIGQDDTEHHRWVINVETMRSE